MNAFERYIADRDRSFTPDAEKEARLAWDAALCAAADALMRNGTAMKTVELQSATMSGISRLHSWSNTEFPKP